MNTSIRVGWGFDAHRLGGPPPLVLGGVVVDTTRGVEAHSDGDVMAHAVCDAVLGAANLGDLGVHFPSRDPAWRGIRSVLLVRRCVEMAARAGVRVMYADVTLVAEEVRIHPLRDQIRAGLAEALGVGPHLVSVKATTTDRMGFVGRGEGIGAVAVVTAVAEGEDT